MPSADGDADTDPLTLALGADGDAEADRLNELEIDELSEADKLSLGADGEAEKLCDSDALAEKLSVLENDWLSELERDWLADFDSEGDKLAEPDWLADRDSENDSVLDGELDFEKLGVLELDADKLCDQELDGLRLGDFERLDDSDGDGADGDAEGDALNVPPDGDAEAEIDWLGLLDRLALSDGPVPAQYPPTQNAAAHTPVRQ